MKQLAFLLKIENKQRNRNADHYAIYQVCADRSSTSLAAFKWTNGLTTKVRLVCNQMQGKALSRWAFGISRCRAAGIYAPVLPVCCMAMWKNIGVGENKLPKGESLAWQGPENEKHVVYIPAHTVVKAEIILSLNLRAHAMKNKMPRGKTLRCSSLVT